MTFFFREIALDGKLAMPIDMINCCLLIKIMRPAKLQKIEIAYIVFIHDDSLE